MFLSVIYVNKNLLLHRNHNSYTRNRVDTRFFKLEGAVRWAGGWSALKMATLYGYRLLYKLSFQEGIQRNLACEWGLSTPAPVICNPLHMNVGCRRQSRGEKICNFFRKFGNSSFHCLDWKKTKQNKQTNKMNEIMSIIQIAS